MTITPVGNKDENPEMEIYLISNDIHIGIMVPKKNKVHDWSPLVVDGYFSQGNENLDWVEFGWGDRQFYFETDKKNALDTIFSGYSIRYLVATTLITEIVGKR